MKQLRIISGEFGGRLIDTPKSGKTHPMGDRERSAIFNSIQFHLAKTVILDAFAGSGALGIEALSRGAKTATFIEKDIKAMKTIKRNIEKFKLTERASIFRKFSQIDLSFDLIFVDPPYEDPQYALVSQLPAHLKSEGLFILSHPEDYPPPDFPELQLISNKSYAAARIKIFQKK